MTFAKTMIAGALAGLMLSGAAFAQTTPAPAAAAPATMAPAPMAAAPAMGMDKKAVSKACSDDATKQGLHGKARKTFRSKCKMEKMKGM